MRWTALFLSLLCCVTLAAQPATVGAQITDNSSTSTLTQTGPVSYVNFTNFFAPVTGTVNKASVIWSGTCSGAFKVVFLRNNSSTIGNFQVVATRGPFDAVAGRNDVILTPPVTLNQRDLIGVVQLRVRPLCGSAGLQANVGNLGFNLVTTGDISIAGALGSLSNYQSGYSIGAFAYDSDPVLARVLPAAGAVQGSSAFFRTDLQLMNTTGSTLTGSLVFHKQGQSASAGDPSLAFTLQPSQSKSYADVITAMGTSGLGSLDIVTNGGTAPIATARVFSDGGSAGTTGFSEEGLLPNLALTNLTRGVLLIPSDLTNFRMNIGVRTLDAGAILNISMFSAGGILRATRTGVTYPPNYFVQVPVADFTGASTIEAGGWILITSTFPSNAFVYSSVIDNRTSDSTYRLAEIR